MKERHRTAINEDRPMLYKLGRSMFDDEQYRLRMYEIIEDSFQ